MLLEEGVCCDQCVLLVKLCQPHPASFCAPRPNLPVTPGISWLSTFHSSPLWWKGHLFFFLVYTHTHTHTHICLRHVERENQSNTSQIYFQNTAQVCRRRARCAPGGIVRKQQAWVLPGCSPHSGHSSVTGSLPEDCVFEPPSIAFYRIVVQSLTHVWLCKCAPDGVFSKATSSLGGKPQEELVTS